MDDVKMTPEEFASLWCYSSEAPLSQAVKERAASIRAEARAEALREAADRAWSFLDSLGPTAIFGKEGLTAAILADEPKEREGLLYKSDVDDRGEG